MTATIDSELCPDGWSLGSLTSWVTHKSGDSKIIKGKQSSVPDSDLVQGYSASGPDVWVKQAQYHGPGIVVSAVGARCGKTFLADGQWTAIANTHAILPKDGLDPKFFWYVTNREEWWVKSGTAQPFVKVKDTLERPFCLPPINEQREIVRILEEQFSRLEAAAASIAAVRRKADQFRRSLLSAAFSGELSSMIPGCNQQRAGWERKHLGDCLEKLKSGKLVERGWSPQCLNNPSGDEDTWGVLKTTAVQMGEFQPEHNKELPLALEPKSALEVEDGDFLLITTSPRNRCGIVCQVKSTRPKLIFSGKILRFRINEEKLLADWLMFYLMSPENQEVLDSLKVGTSDSSVSIGNNQILDLEVPVASMEEQKIVSTLIAEELSRISSLLDLANTAERRVSALRRSLLQAAFTGELTKEWREKNNG